jgi:hypothetical protein
MLKPATTAAIRTAFLISVVIGRLAVSLVRIGRPIEGIKTGLG